VLDLKFASLFVGLRANLGIGTPAATANVSPPRLTASSAAAPHCRPTPEYVEAKMPYDTGATSPESDPAGVHRRGPLRPSRLASARSRLGGDTLARLIQATDLALLAGLFGVRWLGGAIEGSALLMQAASALVADTLASFEP
jgi:hypothetical protein